MTYTPAISRQTIVDAISDGIYNATTFGELPPRAEIDMRNERGWTITLGDHSGASHWTNHYEGIVLTTDEIETAYSTAAQRLAAYQANHAGQELHAMTTETSALPIIDQIILQLIADEPCHDGIANLVDQLIAEPDRCPPSDIARVRGIVDVPRIVEPLGGDYSAQDESANVYYVRRRRRIADEQARLLVQLIAWRQLDRPAGPPQTRFAAAIVEYHQVVLAAYAQYDHDLQVIDRTVVA